MKYPEMRNELLEVLRCLSDYNYQHDVWVKKNYPEGVADDSLDYAVHFIFDDTVLSKDPDRLINFVLKNKEEANLIVSVVDALNKVFDKFGTGLSDEEYINLGCWKDVISASKKAYQTLSSS